MGTTGLDSKFLTASLKFVNRFLGPAREVNVNRGTHTSSKVGGARVDESILLRKSKVLAAFSLDTTSKTLKDTLDISSLLHGDNSHLIFFIDPEKEGLGIIVEDTTTLRPVTLHTSNSKIAVSTDKEEVVINKLLANRLFHSSKRVVLASKIISELGESAAHQLLNINTLLLGDSRGKTISIDGTSDTDTGGVNWNSRVNVSSDLGSIHVGGVLGISTDSMVVLDDSIKDLREVFVAIPVTSIDTTVLVVEFDGASTGLGNGEATSGGLDVLHFIPSLLSNVFGNQGVLRLDFGKFSRHGVGLWV